MLTYFLNGFVFKKLVNFIQLIVKFLRISRTIEKYLIEIKTVIANVEILSRYKTLTNILDIFKFNLTNNYGFID